MSLQGNDTGILNRRTISENNFPRTENNFPRGEQFPTQIVGRGVDFLKASDTVTPCLLPDLFFILTPKLEYFI